jgi:8-oxo-dGTP diphosphatase
VAADGRAAVAVDVVVFGIAGGHEDPELVVLAMRRGGHDSGVWALPGGLVRDDEDLETAARRWLQHRGGLSAVRHLEQLATFGAPDRDSRGRVVSVSYLALVPTAPPGALDTSWWPATRPPPLAYDHSAILGSAIERLRAKLAYSNVAFGLLPDVFTLRELQSVYEAVLGRELDKRNFRKKVIALGMLEAGAGQRRGSHRPAQLYRFTRPGLALLDDVIST